MFQSCTIDINDRTVFSCTGNYAEWAYFWMMANTSADYRRTQEESIFWHDDIAAGMDRTNIKDGQWENDGFYKRAKKMFGSNVIKSSGYVLADCTDTGRYLPPGSFRLLYLIFKI
jgi:hypothetical protein